MGLYNLKWVGFDNQWVNAFLNSNSLLEHRQGESLRSPHTLNMGEINMDKVKKTTPSKKELLKDIEALDKSKVLDSTSLGRTNIANLIAIKVLLS